MERLPQGDGAEGEEYTRPHVEIDLAGPDGNVFNVVSIARQHLAGHALQAFNQTLWVYTEQGSGKTYDDILTLVNDYMDLTDISGMYAAYAPKPPEEPA